MARIVLDIPNEKMQPFLSFIVGLGIDKHSISSNGSTEVKADSKQFIQRMKEKFILFDWEFFSNELEFE
jgi:hypothetical protein